MHRNHEHRFITTIAIRRAGRRGTPEQQSDCEWCRDTPDAVDAVAEGLTNEHAALHGGPVLDFFKYIFENPEKVLEWVKIIKELFSANPV